MEAFELPSKSEWTSLKRELLWFEYRNLFSAKASSKTRKVFQLCILLAVFSGALPWFEICLERWKSLLKSVSMSYMLVFFSFQMSLPHFSLPTSFKRLFPSWLFNWKSRTRSGRKHTCNLFHRLSAELLKQPFNVNAKLRKMKKRRPSPLRITLFIPWDLQSV